MQGVPDRIQGMPGDGLSVRGQMGAFALEVEDLLELQDLIVPPVHHLRGGLHVEGDPFRPAVMLQDSQETAGLHPGIDLGLGLVPIEQVVLGQYQQPGFESVEDLIDQLQVGVPIGCRFCIVLGVDDPGPLDLLGFAVIEAPAGDALPLMERTGGVKG